MFYVLPIYPLLQEIGDRNERSSSGEEESISSSSGEYEETSKEEDESEQLQDFPTKVGQRFDQRNAKAAERRANAANTESGRAS